MTSNIAMIRIHIQWFVRTWVLLRNWPAIFLQKFRIHVYRHDTLLKLRAGPVYVADRRSWGIDDLSAVWLEGVYGDLSQLAAIPSPIIIDIGAHIGTFTIYAALKSPRAKVYALEPNPAVFGYLEKSVKQNGLESRIVSIQKAVARADGERLLFVDESGGVSSSLFKRENRDLNEGISVPCVTLAELFAEYDIKRCHLLKLNCEGAEYEILFNLPVEILERIDCILLQWHRVEQFAPEQLEEFLSARGFVVTRAKRPHKFIYANRGSAFIGAVAEAPTAKATGSNARTKATMSAPAL